MADLDSPPTDADQLIATVQDDYVVPDAKTHNAFETSLGLHDKLSAELSSAPTAPNRYAEVLQWVQANLGVIDGDAAVFDVSADAIAGAIAWEAIQNPKSNPLYGPGKVHPFKRNGIADAEYVEMNAYSGHQLPAQGVVARTVLLHSTVGAVEYIAAIMNAYSTVAEQQMVATGLRLDAPILATFYNGAKNALNSRARFWKMK